MFMQLDDVLRSVSASVRAHATGELFRRLAPKHHVLPPRLPNGSSTDSGDVNARWSVLSPASAKAELLDDHTRGQAAAYSRNIENFVGTVKVPVGVVGPLRVNGTHAQGDYYVPLATTEAALVASYGRGTQLLSTAGGCAAVTLGAGITRAPGFAFRSLSEATQFAVWAAESAGAFAAVVWETSRYARLQETRVCIEGNHVYLLFDFHTGDAAGQNMGTIATEAICDYIQRETPVASQYAFLEANLSGDKKASAQSFLLGRGRRVTAEVVIPRALVEARLHTRPEVMANLFRMSAIGGVLSGTLGVQGHFANGLAALFLACGQDVACVAESANGVTRFEVTDDGALYASVSIPTLPVGTVGGGTGLPSQNACLELLGLAGEGHANAFAEVCAAVVLAGELSIAGAVASGDFARAHERLARGNARTPLPSDSRVAAPSSGVAPSLSAAMRVGRNV
jgi:hydroxymethylglutaryl-CoA reductase (NADPH)